jgi:hypothetical protein
MTDRIEAATDTFTTTCLQLITEAGAADAPITVQQFADLTVALGNVITAIAAEWSALVPVLAEMETAHAELARDIRAALNPEA